MKTQKLEQGHPIYDPADDNQLIAYALRCYAANQLGRARVLLVASRGDCDPHEINHHIIEAQRACQLALDQRWEH